MISRDAVNVAVAVACLDDAEVRYHYNSTFVNILITLGRTERKKDSDVVCAE